MKPLPPYGRSIIAMLNAGLRPVHPAGTVVVACTWDTAECWPRIVIADDPAKFNLAFAAGLDFLVLAPYGHPRQHVESVVRALLAAGANLAPAVVLPLLDEDVNAIEFKEAA